MSEHLSAPTAPPAAKEKQLPHSEFEKDGKLRIVIAGLDKNVRQQAVEAAHERLNAETNERGFFKGFIKGRIWKGNLAREYYLAKYQREAEGHIRENDNLLQHEERSDEAARLATTLRYASEYEDEVVHEGETREKIESDNSSEAQQIKEAVKGLVKQYATGALDDASFEEEKRRQMTMLAESGVSKKYIGEGLIYADNLLQIAQNVKHAIDHGQAMDDLLENAEFIVGEARLGARTEARLSGTERIMKKLEGKAFIHEATVATAVSVVYSVAGWAAKRAVSAAGKLALPGIGAGAIAAMRENRMIKEERSQHMREMAEGKTYDENEPGNKRREKLEGSRYETKTAKELTEQLGLLYDDEGNLRINGDRARFDEAMAIVAEIQARTRISDRDKLDLIGFSNVETIETERFDLDLALAKAKVDLRRMLTSIPDSELLALGIQPTDVTDAQARGMDALTFVLDPRIDAAEGVLGGEMTDKDRVFNKLRAKQVAGAFAKGTVLGMTIGATVQEAWALGTHEAGLIEQAWHGDQQATHETLLNAAFNGTQGTGGEQAHQVIFSGEHGKPIELSDGVKLTLPAEFHAHVADGMLSVTGPNGINLHDLPVGHNGVLSAHAAEALNAAGFHLASTHEVLSHTVTSHEHVSGSEFVHNHQDMTTHVTRDFWYDNGTPNIFEGRELQLDLHYDAHGNIVFDVGRMGLSDQQLHHLQIALSATKGDQHNPFMEHFNTHGQAVIDKDSPLNALFHKGPDGQPVYDGQYAEASEVAGTDAHGVTHIRPLATVVGEGKPSFTDTVTHTETQPATSYVLTYQAPIAATGPETVVDVPPVVPIYSRRGLGRVRNPEASPSAEDQSNNPEIYGYGYGGITAERLAAWEAERSPRMREQPTADLNTGEELRWYRQQQESRRGPEYLNELDGYIEQSEVLRTIGAETEAFVCIPVAAVAESDNIYNTLSLYAQQNADALSSTAIVLNLNWPERIEADPEQLAKIEKTRAEIQRAQADFPQLRIALFEKTWSDEFIAERNGRLYGEVIKILYDVAALAAERGVREGRRADTDEAVIITNDADVKGMAANYLENYLRALHRHSTADIFTGAIRWGTEAYQDYPGYGVSSTFYTIVNMLQSRAGRRRNGQASTTGPNAGFRLSAYAAIGGCEDSPDMGAGADAVLGQRMAAARRAVPPPGRAASGTSVTGAGTTGPLPQPIPTEREISWHVGGAQVDTFPDRLLGAYRRGEWIAQGWAGFDSGGYQDRSISAGLGTAGAEDPVNDIDSVARRIETNIDGFVNGWYRDPGLAQSAISLTFGIRSERGEPYYETGWQGTPGWEGNGTFSFRFTEAGKQMLRNMLTQSGRGFEPYGERIRRQLYETGRLVGPRNGGAPVPPSTPTPAPTPSTPVASPETSPPLTPEEVRRQNLLNTLTEDKIVTAYLGDSYHYNGPMRLLERDGDQYIFGIVDSTTGQVDDADMVVLDEAEVVRFLRNGSISVPTTAA